MTVAIHADAVDEIFRNARSFERFLDIPIPPKLLEEIWDIMKMGPTSANQMPARIVWCASDKAKALLSKACSRENADRIASAPVTAVIGMDLEFHEHLPELFPAADARSWFADPKSREISAFRNSSLQGAYLMIAARAVGLDVGPMSGFSAPEVERAFFSSAPSIKANFICSIGYGDKSSLSIRPPRPPFRKFNSIV
ncbi:malonic semialdehyde reductase [Novosphingobium lindaniclasticum]|uniref:Nitroreductase domain-containing protein n=1 Tax=Novosphingobium lindaniclasticum LE124 TaxID=1096930 RepID=T0HD85_9SPHN|nr:malonic semialdehyde reductase [Novosphingobium lindaniclasticum]EQB14286.1 hypothetical protein L284_12895 [Novosphingobium lindaniclasticum LE124]